MRTRTLMMMLVSLVVAAGSCTRGTDEAPEIAAQGPTANESGDSASLAPVPASEPETPLATGPSTSPAARLVWVGVERGDRAVLVDLDSGEIIEDHDIPGSPHNVTVAPDGTAAAALYATTDLAVVADGEAKIVTLGGRPHDVKATAEWFVVANEAARRLDFVSLEGKPGPNVPLRGEPHDLAIDPSSRRAWVTMNGTDELAVVDLDGAGVDRYVATRTAPHDLQFAPDGRLWVTDWTGRLLILDGDAIVETRKLGVEAHHLAFTPTGAEAWITDHATNELFVLAADTAEVREVIDLPGAPHHVTITADGDLAAVADHTNGRLLVYDTDSREQVDSINVGPGPHGVWAVPPSG